MICIIVDNVGFIIQLRFHAQSFYADNDRTSKTNLEVSFALTDRQTDVQTTRSI